MEALAIILLQLFTWRHCRQAFHKGILAVSSRDVREQDNSVGFDLKEPNFGWLLYSKNYVKRYLALVKYDRQTTVAPAEDDYKKVSATTLMVTTILIVFLADGYNSACATKENKKDGCRRYQERTGRLDLAYSSCTVLKMVPMGYEGAYREDGRRP